MRLKLTLDAMWHWCALLLLFLIKLLALEMGDLATNLSVDKPLANIASVPPIAYKRQQDNHATTLLAECCSPLIARSASPLLSAAPRSITEYILRTKPPPVLESVARHDHPSTSFSYHALSVRVEPSPT